MPAGSTAPGLKSESQASRAGPSSFSLFATAAATRLAQRKARPEECGPGGGGAGGRAELRGRGYTEPRGEAQGAGPHGVAW